MAAVFDDESFVRGSKYLFDARARSFVLQREKRGASSEWVSAEFHQIVIDAFVRSSNDARISADREFSRSRDPGKRERMF